MGSEYQGATAGIEDPRREHREQRHEFTLQYYQMAVEDLGRHLGIGWQTIALVAGTVAALSLGEQGHLPIPIAVASALAVAFWGILNVVDADYWATRAIAFLANVEAVYFTEADRQFLNPYVGRHPPFRMLDSLKYQLWAIICFILLGLAYFAWKVVERAGGVLALSAALRSQPWHSIAFWSLPLGVAVVFLRLSTQSRLTRVIGYRGFVETCPGPGLVHSATNSRSVDLSDTPPAGQWTSGADLQRELLEQVKSSERFWARLTNIVDVLGGALAVGFVIAIASRSVGATSFSTLVAALALNCVGLTVRRQIGRLITAVKNLVGL